ncbi:helix-turn-helix transcriptional regulator [Phytoactinopolyspora endophytica]|uniref:helix-turn-helix transcriptional regulator n=1 Tax=Phytoactinopolyspora endophytica TaxID=1642495 RepID=UPI00101C8640|nr:AraC family transcriptional regulator [Phytoactinopolyspora endophytica]
MAKRSLDGGGTSPTAVRNGTHMRADRVESSVRNWPGLRSEYSWLPPDDTVTVTRPNQVGVSFSAHRRVGYEVGGRARYLAIPAGAVFATGLQEVRWAEVTEPTEALEIYPDVDMLKAVADPAHTGMVEIETVTAGHDATMLGLAAVIRRTHLDHDGDLDAMHASVLVHRLIEHVADHYVRPRPRWTQRSGRLGRTLVDRIAEFVDHRLAEPLTLDDVAAQAHLSVYHFARAFKNTVGMAPHEYVTMRRMEAAKTLLISSRRSVPEVAYSVGYSNVGHFRRLLRRYTGFTPSDLRPR